MEMTALKVTDSSDANTSTSMSTLQEDLLQNILARLPALPFAFAACVSKSWNSLCNRILSCSKISSAVSLKPSLHDAMEEVVCKLMSKPIRPHFAIVNVGIRFSPGIIMQLIRQSFGPKIPVIVVVGSGIMGKDAIPDEFKEVKWDALFSSFGEEECNGLTNEGIVLTVVTCLG